MKKWLPILLVVFGCGKAPEAQVQASEKVLKLIVQHGREGVLIAPVKYTYRISIDADGSPVQTIDNDNALHGNYEYLVKVPKENFSQVMLQYSKRARWEDSSKTDRVPEHLVRVFVYSGPKLLREFQMGYEQATTTIQASELN